MKLVKQRKYFRQITHEEYLFRYDSTLRLVSYIILYQARRWIGIKPVAVRIGYKTLKHKPHEKSLHYTRSSKMIHVRLSFKKYKTMSIKNNSGSCHISVLQDAPYRYT